MYYNQVPIPTYWRQDEVDLTGTWQGNDGSLYYIRQDDRQIWWAAFSENGGGGAWTHVFNGMLGLDESGTLPVISGDWVDVPRGINRYSGALVLSYSRDQLSKISGGIITTKWQRLQR
ncbi:TPA: hypothetical protein QCZ17_005741 [Bacillus cereus]|nr:hypothetical protein [Bacillus cereus]